MEVEKLCSHCGDTCNYLTTCAIM